MNEFRVIYVDGMPPKQIRSGGGKYVKLYHEILKSGK